MTKSATATAQLSPEQRAKKNILQRMLLELEPATAPAPEPEQPTHSVDKNGFLVPIPAPAPAPAPAARKPVARKPKRKPAPAPATAARRVSYAVGTVGKITLNRRGPAGEMPYEQPARNCQSIAIERYEIATGRIIQRFFLGRQESETLAQLETQASTS